MTLPEPCYVEEVIDKEAEKRVYNYRLRIVSDRVEAWIEFHRRRNDLDVKGYPSMPTFERMAAEKAAAEREGKAIRNGATCKKAWACLIHATYSGRNWDREMETDEAIRSMPGSLRRFIKANYLDAGTQEMKSERLGVSVATYRTRLETAMYHLIAFGLARGWFKERG